MRSTFFVLLSTLLIATGCTDPKDTVPRFDRLSLQRHIYNQQILPAFDSASRAATDLSQTISQFATRPDTAGLQRTKKAWLRTALAFQRVSPFCFGAANLPEVGSLRTYLNTFPADASAIERSLVDGYPLDGAGPPRSQRGLPALEYLLFGMDERQLLGRMDTELNRGRWMVSFAKEIEKAIKQAQSQWQAEANLFTTDNSTSAGSAISELYNGFVEDFEFAKNYKLALPLGAMAGQTSTLPNRVEGYYSGTSVQLLTAQLQAIHAIYTGTSLNGQTGAGFDDYLMTVSGGEALVAQTQTQYQSIGAALATLPDQSLAKTIEVQPAKALVLQQEVQKLTRYYKSDLSSLLGLSITFSSNDGD